MKTVAMSLLLVVVASAMMPFGTDSIALDTLNPEYYNFEAWDTNPPRKDEPFGWDREGPGWLRQWDGNAKLGRFSVLPISARMRMEWATKIDPANCSLYRVAVWCSTGQLGGQVPGWIYLTEYYANGGTYFRSKMVHLDNSNRWQDVGWPWKETPRNLDSVLVVIGISDSCTVDVVAVLGARPVHVGIGEGGASRYRTKDSPAERQEACVRPRHMITKHGILTPVGKHYYDVTGRKAQRR